MEPIKEPPTLPEVTSAPPQKERWKILNKGYDACASIIKNLGAFLKRSFSSLRTIKKPSSRSEVLPISFTEETPEVTKDLPTMETLRAAHFRFHRLELDSEGNFVGFGIIDGAGRDAAFNHLMQNDWDPGFKILLASSPNPELEAKIGYLDLTLTKSSFFFNPNKLPDLPRMQAKLALTTLQNFKDGDCVLLPGGTSDHAIVYEVKKQNGKWYLKSYNAGAGAELTKKQFDRFNVPCYEIGDIGSLEPIITELFDLRSLTYDEVKKQKGALSHAVEKIVIGHGGKRLPTQETHRLQDRGDCAMKSLSTWFRAQTSSIEITITQQMVDQAGKYAPSAQKTLAQMVGKKIKLNRFFKILGYEKVRSGLNEIFFTNVGSQPSYEIEEKRKYDISQKVSRFDLGKSIKKKLAKQYLSSLAKRIHKESAAERYEKKDHIRQRTKHVDQVIDKLWAISHLGYVLS